MINTRKKLLMAALLASSFCSQADCWIVANLQGYGAMRGSSYAYEEDRVTDGVFNVTIDKDGSGIYNASSGYVPEMKYTAVSENTLVGVFQAGGGITIETWSISNDKKVLYSKVMNTPGLPDLTSTKSFVGDVVGRCPQKQ